MTQLDALLLTLLLELALAVPLAWPVMRWVPRERVAVLVAAVAACSLVTHPLAWQANTDWLRSLPFETRAPLIEVVVAALEAIGLRYAVPLPWGRAIAVAVVMNAGSTLLGLLLLPLFR